LLTALQILGASRRPSSAEGKNAESNAPAPWPAMCMLHKSAAGCACGAAATTLPRLPSFGLFGGPRMLDAILHTQTAQALLAQWNEWGMCVQ
jgi:hypothetical protein